MRGQQVPHAWSLGPLCFSQSTNTSAGNLFFNHEERQLIVGDWGLGEFYFPGQVRANCW